MVKFKFNENASFLSLTPISANKDYNSFGVVKNMNDKDVLYYLKIRSNFYGLSEVVQVFDKRFTTPEGIGVGSTFADIQKKYNIIRITPSIRSVSIAVKDKPFIFLIDKKELPESLRYSMQPLEAVQIDENIPVSQVLVSW